MSNNSIKTTKRNPWAWIPTLYFAQGLPYVAVMTVTVIMYKRLGMSNTDIALYTGWLGLPWVIKPFWSPFVDMIRTKRWWTLVMQWFVAISLAAIAFTIPTSWWVQLTLAIFMLMGFESATHDIAADGFYMLALTEHEQSLYVGIRSTFYRIATVMAQGVLVILAGLIETNSGLEPLNIQVTADPSQSATEWKMPAFDGVEMKSTNDPEFVASATNVIMSVTAPDEVNGTQYADFAASMRDSVSAMNIANGFYEKVDEAKAEENKDKGDGAFRAWLRAHFGDKREVKPNKQSNIAVIAVRLNQKPEPGKEYILNVTNNKGDQSIKLESTDKLQTRFVFNENNWDKPAYMVFSADTKIKEKVWASFIGASGNIPLAWVIVFITLSVFFFLVVIYHTWALPKPAEDQPRADTSAAAIFKGFLDTFKTFFTKFPIWQTIAAILFMLFYRFPEAQLTKIIQPFLLDPLDKGGLALTTGQVGWVYGTVGIIGLTIGGILGGIVAAKGGLKKWLHPMAWSMSLTCLTFIYLAFTQDQNLLTINICVFIEQFGYGFGFTAYMLYLIYYSEGQYKTAHYAICTGFMALSMMTGMIAGWIQETIGYENFFIWTMICCAVTIIVALMIKVDPEFGLKKEEQIENSEDNTEKAIEQ